MLHFSLLSAYRQRRSPLPSSVSSTAALAPRTMCTGVQRPQLPVTFGTRDSLSLLPTALSRSVYKLPLFKRDSRQPNRLVICNVLYGTFSCFIWRTKTARLRHPRLIWSSWMAPEKLPSRTKTASNQKLNCVSRPRSPICLISSIVIWTLRHSERGPTLKASFKCSWPKLTTMFGVRPNSKIGCTKSATRWRVTSSASSLKSRRISRAPAIRRSWPFVTVYRVPAAKGSPHRRSRSSSESSSRWYRWSF
mmetsp:Transcript_28734/g.46220  ORF Transcript_28734/g.46220 Transcript_28734/m.46220 type:complete len:249 (+) Transcript_28734:1892-2638(+)